MYRFLVTPRWLLFAALSVAAALVMVRLGVWQMHRYEERHAINTRIDAADSTKAVPLASVVTPPTAAPGAGPSPGNAVAWTKVTFSGRYDPAHEIQARDRTVNGDVGFEILTPLLLSDGSGVLVDRGWVPAPDAGAGAAPTVPPAPAGPVTVVGQIHLSESRPTPIEHRDGRLDTRRISVSKLAHEMPYPVWGAYVLLTGQTPANATAFTRIPIDQEDDWQNFGYTIQWWAFAAMTLYAYVYYARKEAQLRAAGGPDQAAGAAPPPDDDLVPARDGAAAGPVDAALTDRIGAPAGAAVADRTDGRPTDAAGHDAPARVEEADLKQPVDRVAEADRRRAEAATRTGPVDRVEEADRRRAEEVVRKERKRAGRRGAVDRVAEADRRRAEAAVRKAPVDRVEEADRKRAEAEAKRKLAAPSGQD